MWSDRLCWVCVRETEDTEKSETQAKEGRAMLEESKARKAQGLERLFGAEKRICSGELQRDLGG